jgi:hypothetical protein
MIIAEMYSVIIISLFRDFLSIQHFIKLIYLQQLHHDFIYFRNSLTELAIQLFINLAPLRLFFYLQISEKEMKLK